MRLLTSVSPVSAQSRPRSIKCQLQIGIMIVVLIVLSGCGLTKDRIHITYAPTVNPQHVSGADAVRIKVNVCDTRTNKADVGRKGNEYDFLGPIVAQEDLTDMIARAVEAELAERGFRLGSDSVLVVAELSKFYNEFKGGFQEKANAEVILNVQVKRQDGQIVFAKSFIGESQNPNLMRTGANAKIALEAALKQAVLKLVNDTSFIAALLDAAKS